MRTLFALLLFIPQIAGTVYLVKAEGWVSGLVFFVFWMIFIGLIARVYDFANRLWRHFFGA